VKPPADDDLVQFSFDLVKILLLSLVTAASVYASFILIGAGLIEVLEDPFMRLVATGVLCGGIPLFTALGENSQKERFRVLERPRDRIIRVLIGSTVFSIAAGFLISVALASTVVRELRTAPNWFVSQETANNEAGLVRLNRKASYLTADAVEWTASALGLYSAPKATDKNLGPVRPPSPTRAQTQGKRTAEPDTTSNQGEALDTQPGTSDDPAGTDDPKGVAAPAGDSDAKASDSKPAADPPSGADTDEDDDYVRW
jgi:hypothetical protein